MNDRERLMKKMSAAQFSMWELHLYLTTHPNDKMAFEKHEMYREKYKCLLEEYESKFGPLRASAVDGSCNWSWVCNPWPWDYGEER